MTLFELLYIGMIKPFIAGLSAVYTILYFDFCKLIGRLFCFCIVLEGVLMQSEHVSYCTMESVSLSTGRFY